MSSRLADRRMLDFKMLSFFWALALQSSVRLYARYIALTGLLWPCVGLALIVIFLGILSSSQLLPLSHALYPSSPSQSDVVVPLWPSIASPSPPRFVL